MRKEPLKNFSHFVTLCCGILTIETSDCFFRSFCFIGQNGGFSTTEQNGENSLVVLSNNSSSNPTTTFSTTASVRLTNPEIFLLIRATFLLLLDSVFRVFVLNVRGFLLISSRFLDFPVLIPFQDAGGVFQSSGR